MTAATAMPAIAPVERPLLLFVLEGTHVCPSGEGWCVLLHSQNSPLSVLTSGGHCGMQPFLSGLTFSPPVAQLVQVCSLPVVVHVAQPGISGLQAPVFGTHVCPSGEGWCVLLHSQNSPLSVLTSGGHCGMQPFLSGLTFSPPVAQLVQVCSLPVVVHVAQPGISGLQAPVFGTHVCPSGEGWCVLLHSQNSPLSVLTSGGHCGMQPFLSGLTFSPPVAQLVQVCSLPVVVHVAQPGISGLQAPVFGTHVCPSGEGWCVLLHSQNSPLSVLTSGGHCGMQPFLSGLTFSPPVAQLVQVCSLPVVVHVAQPGISGLQAPVFGTHVCPSGEGWCVLLHSQNSPLSVLTSGGHCGMQPFLSGLTFSPPVAQLVQVCSLPVVVHVAQPGISGLQAPVFGTHVCPSGEGWCVLLHSQNSPLSVLTSGGHCGMQPFLSGLTFSPPVAQLVQVCSLPVVVHVAQPGISGLQAPVFGTHVCPSGEGWCVLLHSQNSPLSVLTSGGHCGMQPFLSGLTFSPPVAQLVQVCSLPVVVHVAQPGISGLQAPVFGTHVCPSGEGWCVLLHSQNSPLSVLTSGGHCGMQPFLSGLTFSPPVAQLVQVCSLPVVVHVAQPGISGLQAPVFGTHVCPSGEGWCVLLHSQNSPLSVLTSGGHCGMQPFLSGLTFSPPVAQLVQVCSLPVVVHVAQPGISGLQAVFGTIPARTVVHAKRITANIKFKLTLDYHSLQLSL
eukprot:XP_001709669.1 Hypothetical protein GL50803_227577 [Giardia lamblia ATCC 50803]